MRKFLTIVLIILVCFLLVGCKSAEKDVDPTGDRLPLTQQESNLTEDITNTQTAPETVDSPDPSENGTGNPTLPNQNPSSEQLPSTEKPVVSSTLTRDPTPVISSPQSSNSSSPEDSSNSNPKQPTSPQSYRRWYRLGTCKKLEGNIVVLFLYTNDAESTWDSDSLSKFESSQTQKALTYLEERASQYGKNLKFASKSYSVIGGQNPVYDQAVIKNASENVMSFDLLENVCQNMRLGGSDRLFEEVGKEYPNHEIIPVILLNKDGTSYARGAVNENTAMPEHCVVFARNLGIQSAPFLPGNRASTIAHEILHLYGAEDFYQPQGRAGLAGKVYPDDIMYTVNGFINRNKIGDFTAYTVGWTDVIPPVCYDENWWK